MRQDRAVGGSYKVGAPELALVTILSLGLRHGWLGYGEVENEMTFTVPTMAARLVMSGIGSLAGGFAAASTRLTLATHRKRSAARPVR